MKQLLILLFLSNLAFGQSKKLSDEEINNSGASKINFIENCNEVNKLAEKDIEIKLYFYLYKVEKHQLYIGKM